MAISERPSDEKDPASRQPTFMESFVELVRETDGDWQRVLQVVTLVVGTIGGVLLVIGVIVGYLGTNPRRWLLLLLAAALVVVGARLRRRARTSARRGWGRAALVALSIVVLALVTALGAATDTWQGLANQPADKPWDWVERVSWIVASVGAVVSTVFGFLTLRTAAAPRATAGDDPSGPPAG